LGTGVGDEAEDDAVQIRQSVAARVGAVVVGVALQRDVVAADPLDKLERASAVRLALQRLAPAARQNDGVAAGQVEEELGVGLGEHELDSLLVHGADRLDRVVVLRVRNLVRFHVPLHRGDDVLCREIAAVVERDALAQFKRPGEPVVADFGKRLGHAGHDVAVAIEFDQALIDVVVDDAVDVGGRVGRRIEAGRLGRNRHGQGAADLRLLILANGQIRR